MAFLFGLRALLECLGKADDSREERDRSGQELHELGEIGHGHHLPSNGGLCPARELPTARTILSERLTLPDALCFIQDWRFKMGRINRVPSLIVHFQPDAPEG